MSEKHVLSIHHLRQQKTISCSGARNRDSQIIDQLAAMEDQDAVRQGESFIHVVRDKEHGPPILAVTLGPKLQ